MKIPSGLDFSNITVQKIFDNTSSQYKKMIKMNDEFEWGEYTNTMLSKGVSVIYDASGDFFVAKPVAFKENKMKSKFKKESYERTLSIGDNITWINEQGQRQKGTLLESNNKIVSVYNTFTGEIEDLIEQKKSIRKLNENPGQKYLLHDEDESELDDEDIDLESKHSDLINLTDDLSTEDNLDDDLETADTTEMPIEPEQTGSLQGLASGQVTMEDLQRLVSEIMAGNGSGSQIKVDDKFHSGEAGTVDQSTEPTNDILGSEFAETQEDVANVENKIESEETYLEYLQGDSNQVETVNGGEEFEIYEEPSESEMPIEAGGIIQEDDDLEILSPADYEDGDLDQDDLQVKGPAEIVQSGSSIDCRGVPVKVQITGWLITVPEVNSLSEAIRKSGGTLRGLGSKDKNRLALVVESNKKLYKIIYEDRSRTETQKPWSVGKLKFTSLTEAVKKIKSVKISNKEKFFKKLIGESNDLNKRSLTNIKDADIFDNFRNEKKNPMNYTAGWNIKAVGQLDLKKGMNEVYSNITQGSKTKNTLFKTKSGQYYLLKGNLGESSQKGTKKELLDLEGKKNYGVGQVVGLYENTIKGLGQIMFKIKRTSIPMMIWKQRY